MRILVTSEDIQVLDELAGMISGIAPDAGITVLSGMDQMIVFLKCNECDVIFVDIKRGDTTAIEIIRNLKADKNELNVIFVSDVEDCAADAMSMHASGYLLKPVREDEVRRELEDLRYDLPERHLLRAQCFGNFDVFTMAGEPIRFNRSKAKELLAILISKKGAACTIKELTSMLFETSGDDEKKKDYTQQLISSMLKKFRELGLERVVNKSYNNISVNVEYIDCDYYRFNEHDRKTLRGYSGEFMAQYSWAEHINGYLDAVLRGV